MLCDTGDAFEIRVVSDRYLESSLKENTAEKRRQGLVVTEYEVADNSSLKNIHSMSNFFPT